MSGLRNPAIPYTKIKGNVNFSKGLFSLRKDISGVLEAITSFELLGSDMIIKKYEPDPRKENLKLEELEKACSDYIESQQYLAPRGFALNNYDRPDDSLKKLVEDIWGINTVYRIIGDKLNIASQRLNSDIIAGLAEACCFWDSKGQHKFQYQVVTSNLQLSMNNPLLKRIGIPIENLREVFENTEKLDVSIWEFIRNCQKPVLMHVDSLPNKKLKLGNDGEEESPERLQGYSSNEPAMLSVVDRVEKYRESGKGIER
ncbi:hypothetical protein H1Q59_06735 [Holosporaceae bacterium 'Namur']|nr:hypothetical protein [Holosporaceae bacterium 'Namur']